MENVIENEFEGYTRAAKYQLFALFFFLGVLNHLGTILVMTGGRLLANQLDMGDYVPIYTSVSTVFNIVIRMLNSRLCLKVSYKKRVIIIMFSNILGYISMFGVLKLHEGPLHDLKELCFILSFIPCFLLGASYAFGEAAMLAYLRLFPKTLIAGWTSGTGVSGCISGFLNFLTQLIGGLSLDLLYLILTPVGPLYFLIYFWTSKLLLKETYTSVENQNLIKDGEDKDEEENNPINNDENIIEPKNDEEKDDTDKNIDDMNKLNKTMNCNTFVAVMNMCGRTIVNLGLIYFFYFICISCLIIRDCERIDIPFLPCDTKAYNNTITNETIYYDNSTDIENITVIDYEKYRRGKFEFINLFFQLGMFTAKTFIKIVRKIQPIEIYTGSILCITVIFFVEYYTGFMPYWLFPIVNYILGCFAGGTYSGAFYSILHSGKVSPEYKELTVNVATLYNDTGTFLSGIVGYLLIKFLLEDTSPFPGEEVK